MKIEKHISVNKAINYGQFMVNLPVLLFLVGTPLIVFYLVNIFDFPQWLGIIGFFLGIILSWFAWSILITKWRIWAFSSVNNVHELRRKAIQKKLIWKTGTIFEKTEYRSKKDKLSLKKLEEKFNLEDVFEEDPKLSKEVKIYYSIATALFVIIFLSFGFIAGVCLIIDDSILKICFGFFLAVISLFVIIENIKNIMNRQPQIIIDAEGIKATNEDFRHWSDIYDEQILTEGYGSSAEHYLIFGDASSNYTKIDIVNLTTTPSKLENILRTYRIRYNKNNKI
ncbi:hypothetical protein [Psychroserpens sp.]|uniref:hypothetical protein n=1 Tax=Psychroserpens sp. TaxID=2020870 RepID=UPI003C7725B0